MDAHSFVDECTIHVRGGMGGNGVVSFRREAHVPRGGPDGGDGGRGGDVVLVADANVDSLIDLHRAPHQRAGDGTHGQGMARTGADGADRLVRVPVGTLVRDRDTGEVRADLVVDGQRVVIAPGGRGGRGNLAFANHHRRLPRFAERGEHPEERSLRLELKLIADVGLVGFPSAGKSSLIRQLSSATPRVEAWPFTTLTPQLGVMRAGNRADGSPIDVVLADVPGLVEGAAVGRGLGLKFLRHVERCHLLLHVLDTAPYEPDRDPVGDLEVLRNELRAHDASLAERPQLIVLNKVDLPDGRAMADLVRDTLEAGGEEVVEVSALTGHGIDRLRFRLGELVADARGGLRADADAAVVETVIRIAPRDDGFTVTSTPDGWRVTGRRIERWVQMLPLEEAQAVRYLQGRLRRAGVDRALARAGARSGDDVVIGEAVFTFDPELDDLPAQERAEILAAEEDDVALEGAWPDADEDPEIDR